MNVLCLFSIIVRSEIEGRIIMITSRTFAQLPIEGFIAAGRAIQALNQDFAINVGHWLFSPNRYVLRVCGDSMSGDNICDGDYVVCEYTEVVKEGEIVVALIDNDNVTLKRIHYTTDETILLLPSNPEYAPSEYQAEEITIQGRYVGLLRIKK